LAKYIKSIKEFISTIFAPKRFAEEKKSENAKYW
jgi:hypothetical protein